MLTLQVHRGCIDYFHCALCITKRVFTSKNAIKKLFIKLEEYLGHYLTSFACLDNLKIDWKEYQAAKKEAWVLQKTIMEDKIVRKAHDRNVTTKNMVKMMKHKQQSIQEGIDLQQISGR